MATTTNVERSLLMIKPKTEPHTNEITRRLRKEGFTVVQSRRIQMTHAQASDFYRSQSTKITFSELVGSISKEPVTVIVCGKANAAEELKKLCGPDDPAVAKEETPDSLRALYGEDMINNGVHCSLSLQDASAEIRMFFPQTKLEPLANVDDTQAYLEANVNATLLQGLSQLCKEKPDRPIEWIAHWLQNNNPNQPTVEAA